MHATGDDDEVVDVRRRDVKRWNKSADVVEKGTIIARAMSWALAKLAIGVGILLAIKQYTGWGK